MKMGFLLFMLLPLASIVYVLWHVYQLLPLPTWGKWLVVVADGWMRCRWRWLPLSMR